MGSDCEVHLAGVPEHQAVSRAAEAEIRRIEARYSRFDPNSELSRINEVAKAGGAIELDDETAALIVYAMACYARSGGAFDITSGLLSVVWNFHRARLPRQVDIAALLPRIGLDQLHLEHKELRFGRAGMEIDLGGLAKEYAADCAAERCMASLI